MAMKVTESFVNEAKRIDRMYDYALSEMNLPRNTADGDALMVLIEDQSKYKTKEKQDQLFYYITMNLWQTNKSSTINEKKELTNDEVDEIINFWRSGDSISDIIDQVNPSKAKQIRLKIKELLNSGEIEK